MELNHTPRAWLWLFPATYTLHILEEAWSGETFPRWISRVASVEFTTHEFWWLNGLALAAMAGAIFVCPAKRTALLGVVLGTIVFVNATAHALGSLVTLTYSPGVITGVVFWWPLGGVTLRRARRALERRTFALGIALGVLLHALVSARALAERWWPG